MRVGKKRSVAIVAWAVAIGITIVSTVDINVHLPPMEVHMSAHVDLKVQGEAGGNVVHGGADPRKRWDAKHLI